MSLTAEMIIDYLLTTRSLSMINNHAVRDFNGSKTGQTPSTIAVGKQWITDILELDDEREQGRLNEQEKNALINLRDALDSLPISMGFHSLMSAVKGLDGIQKNLLKSVNDYLASITQFEEHKQLLKAIVLVLKIIAYDLSKNPGPITMGYGFFKIQILSNEQRVINHSKVEKLLSRIIEEFDKHFEQEHSDIRALA